MGLARDSLAEGVHALASRIIDIETIPLMGQPSRFAADTTYDATHGPKVAASLGELAEALRGAEAAHTEHERRTGERAKDWPDWYANYLAREQSGEPLPTSWQPLPVAGRYLLELSATAIRRQP